MTASSSTGSGPTIVLVHGAWADGSSWLAQVIRLQREGYSAVALPNTQRGLSKDSAVVRSYLDTIGAPVVLVGHSYGGAVITNAATGSANVRALVYVDAIIPDEGQVIAQLVGPNSALAASTTDPTSVFKLVPAPDAPERAPDAYLLPEVVRTSFANDLTAEQQGAIHATQRPASLAALADTSGPPAWRGIPSWALIGTQDRIIPPPEQRAMATNANAEIVEVDASHVSMISKPDDVTDLILTAIAAVTAKVA